jgi:alpha-tubulin suppressor-like RCC1 family protein
MAIKTIFFTTTGAGTFTVPLDFESFVSVEAIGGGGGGRRASGAGGSGGGAYSRSTTMIGITVGTLVYYNVGAGGTSAATPGNGGDSWCSLINAAPAVSSSGVNGILAKGGTAATTSTGAAGGASASGAGDVRNSGGNGGNGSTATGGGGGAAGPGGNGGNGANGTTSTIGGGGGGGANLTNPGGNASSGTGGNGGGGTGAGSQAADGGNGAAGTGGGGGGATSGDGGNGGTGSYWTQTSNATTAGSGGGGGGAQGSVFDVGGFGALYGGGTAGSIHSNQDRPGAQGIIVFTYDTGRLKSNYRKDDPVFGTIDLDEQYVTDSWLVDKYVGGTLFTWSQNNFGQIGNGSSGNYYSSPVQVGNLTNWKQIACGTQAVMGIKNDGTMWGWGFGINGGLMIGTNVTITNSPVQVGALTTWKQVSVFYHSLAIKNDGTLWAAGNNQYGTLGNGNITNYSSPIQVGSLPNWKQSSASFYTSAAVKLDGTLWMWGSNFQGQLGQGYSSISNYYSSPIQVGSLTNWKQVSISAFYSFAIKTDGTLWAWGANGYGQLGIGNRTYYSSPVQVGTLTNWKYVSSSKDAAVFAIKTDGTLWAWGTNINGELGIGVATSLYYASPVQVGSLTNWKYVEGGGGSTPTTTQVLAVKTDGTLWSWGYNFNGDLGIGNRTYYSSPVQVGSLTNWKSVACGNGTSTAITFTDLN